MMASKRVLMTLRRLMGRYFDGVVVSTVLLNTGHILDTFDGLSKHFFLKQWLNIFTKFGEISDWKFLRPTTGISYGPVAIEESRLLISLKTSRAGIEISRSLCSVGWGKLGKGRSKLELVAKFISKNEITSRSFLRSLFLSSH